MQAPEPRDECIDALAEFCIVVQIGGLGDAEADAEQALVCLGQVLRFAADNVSHENQPFAKNCGLGHGMVQFHQQVDIAATAKIIDSRAKQPHATARPGNRQDCLSNGGPLCWR